jgi:cytochrome c oxidase subunit II
MRLPEAEARAPEQRPTAVDEGGTGHRRIFASSCATRLCLLAVFSCFWGEASLPVTPRRPPRTAVPIAVGAALLAGCGGGQNVLRPESPQQDRISDLFWIMLGGCLVALGVVAALLLLGWLRRRRRGVPGGDGAGSGIVVVLGVAVPIVVLSALFWYSNLRTIDATAAPAAGSGQLQVVVTGHQWFWEVAYPGTEAVTANEIHIPAGVRVELVARSADVVHSFWVPRLNRKIDMIPGHPNRILLYANRPGIYRGRCSEFCGLQHANMQLLVVAEPPEEFQRWLADMREPAAEPVSSAATRGRDIFLTGACAGCHTIRGTSAEGTLGPDLTHLGSRQTLAAGTLDNTRGDLAAWVLDPHQAQPGNRMPRLSLPESDVADLVAYLETLR